MVSRAPDPAPTWANILRHMGGIGFSLALTKTGGDDAPTVEELHGEVFPALAKAVKALAKGKAYRQVTEEYIDLCEEDGESVRSGDQLFFAFRDSGGCSLSMVASEHWFRLVIAALREKPDAPLDAFVARRGWRITTKPESLTKLLGKSRDPLVEVRGVLYLAGRSGKKPYIETDDGLDALAFDELSAKDRARVEVVLTSRVCPCVPCEALRAGKRPALPKGKADRRGGRATPHC